MQGGHGEEEEVEEEAEAASLVWPPMLFVCIHGIEAKQEALGVFVYFGYNICGSYLLIGLTRLHQC